MVVEIVTKETHSHLVAIVKGITTVAAFVPFRLKTNPPVPEAEGRGDIGSPWYIFNDFVVANISEEEALSFPGPWKVWTLLYTCN